MAKQTNNTSKTDRLEAFTVRDWTDKQEQKHTEWTRVGVAFPIANGFRLQLHALPLDGVLILQTPKPAE